MKDIAQEKMVLRVVASESSWIKFQLDLNEPYEVLMKAGETYTVRAKDMFNLKIGNAGGVELFLDERSLVKTGKRGGVMSEDHNG